ncbi:MAG: NDP-sugar synthase [Syntrophothermus sp.]|nr:NDP-sugar synthase [Syntrophothermus sp.]
MRAMIMAAGVGSRLMPLTAEIPKPMVPVANRPVMENILGVLRRHGITEIIANLHCHGPVIKEHFGDGASFGVSLLYSEEKELLGTAGGVRRCEWFLGDTFVVMSGDALTDVDLTDLVEAHKRNGALATIALREMDEVEHYGVVIVGEDGFIQSFQEKPRREEASSRLVNTGIYVFEREIFDYIPEGEFYDFGRQVFPHLVRIRAPFYGHVIDRYWCDVGDVDAYRQAHRDVLEGRVNYPTEGQLLQGTLGVTSILLGEGVELGRGVTLKGCVVIGPRCRVGDRAVLQDVVIWEDTVIEAETVITGSVIGSRCRIGRGAAVGPGAVIGSRYQVHEGTIVPENARLMPPR